MRAAQEATSNSFGSTIPGVPWSFQEIYQSTQLAVAYWMSAMVLYGRRGSA
ncbi:hypothetical protein [Gulosibacter sediminis]|uniref:hypothetical protein n=1 Tax=Gulosibacter sediminis TaxID=1729695 RepID=UPI0024AE365A|nr:hypothetical protein [Gulosibacter sediminis]